MIYNLDIYPIYLNIISLAFELSLLISFILYTIYMCFFYFNKLYVYTAPMVCVYVFSLLILFFLAMNLSIMSFDVFGGIFYIHHIDGVVRDTVVIFSIPLIYNMVIYFAKYYSIVNIIEYTVLLYLLLFATCFVLYCNDILSLFLFMELQSMVVYILICLRCDFSSITIGIRYFMLGTMVSLLFLIAFTVVYYISGISSFIDYIYISSIFSSELLLSIFMFLYILFMFKLYIFPFHFIGGDLYRHSPMYILFFISSILYYTYMYIFFKLTVLLLNSLIFIYILIFLTLIFATLNILVQRDIRSFLGFGTSVHSALLMLIAFMDLSINIYACLFYTLMYIISVLGILVSLHKFYNIHINTVDVRMNKRCGIPVLKSNTQYLRISRVTRGNIEHIANWSGLYRHYKYMVFILSILIWSMAGLPPFSGFFAKFCILSLCYISNNIFIFFFILLVSIVSSLYYVKIIKEFYYIKSRRYFYDDLTNIEIVCIYMALVICFMGILIPEFFIIFLY